MFRRVAAEEGWQAARVRSSGYAWRTVRRLGRHLASAQVTALDHALGAQRANVYFWQGPGQRPEWEDVQHRLERLHELGPEYVSHFVITSLERTNDPIVIIALAQHPLSRATVRTWLPGAIEDRSERLVRRAQKSRLVGAAFAAAAKLVLDAQLVDDIVEQIEDLYQIPDVRFHQFMASLGVRVGADSSSAHDRPRRPCRNRLVIVENATEADAVGWLLPGADRTTILATSDTFGHADLSKYEGWPGVGELVVEHIRTRIPRFSQPYIDLHLEASALASQAIAELDEVPGLVRADLRPLLEVGVADFIFFQALKLRAIEELLADHTFDQIVVGLDDLGRSREFAHTISAVDGLLSDPRTEIASLSTAAPERARFWTVIDELNEPTVPTANSYARLSQSLVFRKFDQDSDRLASTLTPLEHGARPSVLFVTSSSPTYNDSTAGYLRELESEFDVRVLVMGGDLDALVETLGEAAPPIVDQVAPFGARFVPLADTLAPRLRALGVGDARTRADSAARRAIGFAAHRILREAIGPPILSARALEHWLDDADRHHQLPDIIMLTPQRSAAVSLLAPLARRYGIPTLAVEPHAQDANYSRYTKVSADYYGVMADYFRTQTKTAFGIDSARSRTIGSPRQVAPVGYDPVVEQHTARRDFTLATGYGFTPQATYIVFFSQPSAWGHVVRVWETILCAAESKRCEVLLKPHPEESVGRVQQYIDHAAVLGAADPIILETDAATAVALGDIIVTMYSTGAFDAAIRQKPVLCVTDGDVRYPVDLPAILDIPLARSVEELSEIIEAFQRDPEEFRARARSVLEREDHFVSGPGPRLRAFVSEIIAAGADGVRPAEVLPASLFLDGPHPVFTV